MINQGSNSLPGPIVITGGGTGGHIYPGLAIAEEILKQSPSQAVHFVGAQGALEEKILPKGRIPYHLIRMDRLHRSVGVLRQLKTLCLMPFSLLHALIIFIRLQPSAVIGVGGFASGPFLFIAWLFRAKTAIWEANAYPGLANRWLSRLVDKCYVVFAESEQYLHTKSLLKVGMPVRTEFFGIRNRQKVRSAKMRILVFGGSQGARAINNVVLDMILKHPHILDLIEIKHQTGTNDFKRIRSEYKSYLDQVQVLEYIYDMPAELYWADLVICRSGASTVAEVMTSCRPAIFIPLPTAADNHQHKNALVLSSKKGAFLMEQAQLSGEKLFELLSHICKNQNLLDEMTHVLKQYDFSQSASLLVNDFLKDQR